MKKCIIRGQNFQETSSSNKYCSEKCRGQSPAIQVHVGETFGELEIISAGFENKKAFMMCKCSCGKIIKTRYDSLKSEKTKSCGHLTQFKEIDITDECHEISCGCINDQRIINLKTAQEKYCHDVMRKLIMFMQ